MEMFSYPPLLNLNKTTYLDYGITFRSNSKLNITKLVRVYIMVDTEVSVILCIKTRKRLFIK